MQLSESVQISGKLLAIGKLGAATGSLGVEKLEHRCAAVMEREVLDVEGLFGSPEVRIAACVAGGIPALRAASVDPVRALRME